MEEDTCIICLETLTDSVWINLSKNCCNLSVHLFCLEAHQQKVNQNCPHCRKSLTFAQVNSLDLNIPEPNPDIKEVPHPEEEPNHEQIQAAESSSSDIHLPLVENGVTMAEVDAFLEMDDPWFHGSIQSVVILDSSEDLEIPSLASCHEDSSLEIPDFDACSDELFSSDDDC